MFRALSLILILVVSACSKTPQQEPVIEYKKNSYTDIADFENENFQELLPAFKNSCKKIASKNSSFFDKEKIFGRLEDWQYVCKAAENLTSNSEIKDFVKNNFTPYQVITDQAEEGLLTGYFELELAASHIKSLEYRYPIYRVPEDFREDKPYHSRYSIDYGVLEGRGLELYYVNDPVRLFFLQIQGSGILRFADGSTQKIGYAGKNNNSYVTIGRYLISQGLISRKDASAKSVQQYLYDNPIYTFEVMQQNPSYVFFKKLDTNAPVGAHAVELTAERSIAIDHKYHPYGMMFWISSQFHDGEKIEKMVVAQDTGGAIKGVLRADFFMGSGERAENLANHLKSSARFYIFIPNSLKN